ncbi:hypothetical protein FB384_004921 [Prauserella sediminis]|uniref:Uncharacterized protein n=1 Tax=Prauserella sediminis TaxID=577680 RepID=A0A839XQ70_9PSEU|nr:hypothetical protein [Prauserella sediminis]MBB3665962.1 hypothetical protein [Prauserella sediminis]
MTVHHATRLRTYEQDTSIYVLGTTTITEALAALPDDVTHWAGTFPGQYVRRQGQLRGASDLHPPKDARPGVAFLGVKRGRE